MRSEAKHTALTERDVRDTYCPPCGQGKRIIRTACKVGDVKESLYGELYR